MGSEPTTPASSRGLARRRTCRLGDGHQCAERERQEGPAERSFHIFTGIEHHRFSLYGLGRVHTKVLNILQLGNGNYRSSVRTHCANSPSTTWQCQTVEPASAQRNPVRRRAGLQVAGIATPVWQLAHRLHPDEPMVEERSARPDIRIPAAGADRAHQAGGGVDGQHYRQGPSRRNGCAKKGGSQSIGKSRGGWIHMVAADARTAITFSLSPGQAHDAPEGRKLLTRLGPQCGGTRPC